MDRTEELDPELLGLVRGIPGYLGHGLGILSDGKPGLRVMVRNREAALPYLEKLPEEVRVELDDARSIDALDETN